MTKHILKNESKTLTALFKKVAQIRELNQIFAQYIDENLAAHCEVASIQNDCLIVIVDSGNWATQLRFHIPDLLNKIRQTPSFQTVKAICCKTRPAHKIEKLGKKRNSRPMKQISSETAKEILKAAEGIEDSKLRAIMKKIATRNI